MRSRTSLLEATQDLLWQRGYAATSPRAVMRQAQVGQGSMYHHFENKEALAAEAFALNAAETYARAKSLLCGSEQDASSRVAAYLFAQRDVLLGCPVGRMASDADVLASSVLSDILRTTFARIRQLLTAVLTDAVEDGELTAIEPTELADTLLAVVQGGYVLARAAGDAEPFNRAVRGISTLLGSYAEARDDAPR